MDPAAIARAVVAHYRHARRDLPWRRTRDPYAIWISEIMLQQTRVHTVIPYWERWMTKFPTVTALARAPLDDVLAAWAGLGYYSRARNLHAGAATVVARWSGTLPSRATELREVPGIGRYTAGAIASIAFDERTPLVDGNVARLLARVYAVDDDIKSTAGQRALWTRAGELVAALAPRAAPGDLNQGLIELGATVCTPTSPRCPTCPLVDHCEAARLGTQDRLPIARARKKQHELAVLARAALWILDDNDALLLARRQPGGLFGGLWELPQGDSAAVVARTLGARFDREPVAHVDQVLTHRRLQIAVYRASLARRLVEPKDPSYDAVRYVSLAEARQLGIAAATTAILTKYEDIPWSSTKRRSPSSTRATTRSSKASRSSATTPATRTSRRPRSARRRASTSSSTTRSR